MEFMCISFTTQVVEVEESESKGIVYKHYLLQVSASVFDAAGEEVQVEEEQPQQAYMRPGHLLQLDTFLCTHSNGSAIHGEICCIVLWELCE